MESSDQPAIPTFPVAVSLLLRQNGNLFLMRRYNTGYEDGNYCPVTGFVQQDEDAFSAMIRITKETLDIDIKRSDLSVALVMQRKKDGNECVDIYIECEKWKGDDIVIDADRCDDVMWVSPDRLPLNTVDYAAEAIASLRKKSCFLLFGW